MAVVFLTITPIGTATPSVSRYVAGVERILQESGLVHQLTTGAFLVITATGNQLVHNAVWAEGNTNGQLVNVMDVIPQCNFHAAAVVRQGQLTLAIGPGGAAPALAATLRRRFEKAFGPEYAEFLEYAQALRPIVRAFAPSSPGRFLVRPG